jgi:hypothetical protein
MTTADSRLSLRESSNPFTERKATLVTPAPCDRYFVNCISLAGWTAIASSNNGAF